MRTAQADPAWPLARDDLTQTFDVDGHLTRAQHQRRGRNNEVTVETVLRNSYGRDGTLRVAQRYSDVASGAAGAFEEYRYDALGRRVMVIGRAGTPSTACTAAGLSFCEPVCNAAGCVDQVTRAQWDGDQMLSELRTDLSDGTPNNKYGAIAYVHGLDLDHPLATLDANAASGVRVLTPDWPGMFESSVTTAGAPADCSLNGSLCPARTIAFPGGHGVYTRPSPAELGSTYTVAWAGSLVTDQQDATGTLYRRNRYSMMGHGAVHAGRPHRPRRRCEPLRVCERGPGQP